LVELLPHPNSSNVALLKKVHGVGEMTISAVAIMLICAALAVTALIIAASREPHPGRGFSADTPASSTSSPPQTPLPSSHR